MKKTLKICTPILFFTITTLFIGCNSNNSPIEPADTIYLNGQIYTVNKDQPWAEAMAVRNGKFIKIGSTKEVEATKGPNTEVIDLQGQFGMPGIGDAHIHPALLMPKRAFCALPGTFYEPSEEDIIKALKEGIANYPEDREWFVAQGYTTPAMSEETLTREFLDRLIPDKPAWIEDETGHRAWFNTKAMEVVGVDKSFKDTPEAFFSRTADGDLAGVALEGAMNPFLDMVLPTLDKEVQKAGYTRMLDEALSMGVTMFGDAYVFEGDLEAYEELNKEGKIKQYAMLYLKGNLGTPELTPIDTLEKWWREYDLPGKKGVKLGMGGAIESASEVLVDGYLDPKNQARLVIPEKEFADYVKKLDDAGFQVIVHAIGDGTVRATIDGYEKVIQARGNNDLRHRIEHASLVHPDDFSRLTENDIAITIWPQLNAPISYNLENVLPMLKPETRKRIYDNKNRLEAGIKIFNHSDAPAATFWPWWGMEAAVTRGFPGKPENGKLNEDQAISVEDCIEIYTINTAWALKVDDVTGSIEEGKFADFIILNHNLLEIPATEIHNTRVESTIIKGNKVFSN